MLHTPDQGVRQTLNPNPPKPSTPGEFTHLRVGQHEPAHGDNREDDHAAERGCGDERAPDRAHEPEEGDARLVHQEQQQPEGEEPARAAPVSLRPPGGLLCMRAASCPCASCHFPPSSTTARSLTRQGCCHHSGPWLRQSGGRNG